MHIRNIPYRLDFMSVLFEIITARSLTSKPKYLWDLAGYSNSHTCLRVLARI
ncbi:hypothetical protein F383_39020 [Gossypium arboreum]|uniref:Uncharacterized protein n=1 Tax=Gossypium arboreum TaxID=29729 RepID=A0A0B0MEL8_GOSAR|nr:hypothetical protein F383_39020 [Gossypium arboreum]